MTETPRDSRDDVQTDSPSSPQAERPPYAGSEWRRPDAPSTPPQTGAVPQTGHGVAPEFGSAGDPAQDAGAPAPEPHANGFGAPSNGTDGAPQSPWAQHGPAPEIGRASCRERG